MQITPRSNVEIDQLQQKQANKWQTLMSQTEILLAQKTLKWLEKNRCFDSSAV